MINRILRERIQITEESNIFFCSDIHFSHSNVINFDKRPFDNVIEMNEIIIKNWNDTVRPNDKVFYLGDFAFASKNKINELAWRLNGKIYFIMGNHDKYSILDKTGRFEGIWEGGEIYIKYDDNSEKDYQHIVMSHYPMLVWNKHSHGSVMIHGHCHQNMKSTHQDYYKRRVEDMGINGWDYKPVSFKQLMDRMENRLIVTIDHH